MEEVKEKNMIELIYQAKENELDEAIKNINQKIKDQIKEININEILKKTTKEKEIEKIFEKIEDNYSIKIAEYNKEFYKQGFIDGIHLMINCIKNENIKK